MSRAAAEVLRRLVGMLAVGCALGAFGDAATAAPDPPERARLESRLDPAVASAVGELVDEARRRHLPTEPLVATALEGVARGVPAERILGAVRAQAAALEVAALAFGLEGSAAEIVAGASALRARVPADSLTRLRAGRRGSVLVPLVVLADMVARGVSPHEASGALIVAARAGMRDGDLVRLREQVARDIGAGVAPGEAARVRTQALLINAAGRAPEPAFPPRSPVPGGRR